MAFTVAMPDVGPSVSDLDELEPSDFQLAQWRSNGTRWNNVSPSALAIASSDGIGLLSLAVRAAFAINVRDFYPDGYDTPADGTSHPLSDHYTTLAEAQEDYSFVVSLNQQIDAAAYHAAYLTQIGNTFGSQYAATGERAIFVPAGNYYVPAVAIASIADNGGGTILVTTSTPHSLFAGGWCMLSENTYVNGYQVLTTPSDTTFTVTATFTETATGYVSYGLGQSGTGQCVFGDGMYVTRFDGPVMVIYHRAFSAREMSFTGSGGAGLCYINSSRRFSHVSRIHVRDKRYGSWHGAGADDVVDVCLFEKNIRNSHFPLSDNATVVSFNHCIWSNATVWNMFAPNGEIKVIGGFHQGAGVANMIVRERTGGASSVECYFNSSYSGASVNAFFTISSVSNNGDGTVTITTSADHNLEPEDEVEHFETTDYNGLYTVLKVPSRTTYTVTDTFTSSQAGIMRYKHARVWKITAIANAGGGNIEITTNGNHDLRGNMLSAITISGTTDYNGTYSIVARTASNKFTVAATYVSSQTGTVAMRGWDVITDADDSLLDVNDMWFDAMCNINYLKIHGANKITFYGRLKQQIHMSAAFNRFVMYGDLRGRNTDSFSDIIPDGDYSNTNWVAYAARDDVTTTNNNSYASIMRPDSASAVGTDGFPILHEVRIGATSIDLIAAGVLRQRIDTTSGITFVPLSSATPASNGELTVEATSNTSLTFKLKGSDGTVRSGSLTLS